jgi:hypothetical protein
MKGCVFVFGVWGMLACHPVSTRGGAGTAHPASAAFERACQERGEVASNIIGRVTGSFRICLSSSGRIRSITTLKATGVPVYDEQLIRTMYGTWRYRPFMVDGVATQACTRVTFNYRQG